MTRARRLIRRARHACGTLTVAAASRIPPKIAAAPERVMLHAAFIVLGVAALVVSQPGSLSTLTPPWVTWLWSASLSGGGLAALAGYWRDRVALSRLGQRLLVLGSVVIVAAVLLVAGLRGLSTAVIFGLVALAYTVRLIISSAAAVIVRRTGPPG